MKKALGLIVGIVAGLIGLVVLVIAVAAALLQTGALNGLIEDAIAAQAGRPARLEADPSLGFDHGALTLRVGPLGVANADWAQERHADFARIQEVRASLRLLPLLRGRIELPEVVVEGPQIHLARAENGEVNWPQGGESQPQEGGTSLPRIERLVIRNATMTYADAQAAAEIALKLDDATGRLGGDQTALQATGSLQDTPLELSATGGSLTELLDQGAMSEPATIEATIGKSRITAQATAFEDLQALDATVEIDAAGTLTDLLASLGVATAELPPFQASTQVEPGEGGSVVTADVSTEGASVHLDGKVDNLAAPLNGFATRFTVDAPQLGPILASFKVPHAEQIPSAKLAGEAKHEAESTTVALSGDVGGDAIELQGRYEGAITAFLNPRVDLSLEGAALGALPAQLGFARRPIEHYRIVAKVKERSGETSPVKLDVTIEKTRVRFDGSVDELRAFKGIDGKIRLEGPDPAAVLDLFKLPAISLPPYQVVGQVAWRGDAIEVTGLDGTVGDSDAQGDIAIDLGPEPPAVVADLRSELLDLDDLAGLIGAPPATGAGETASPAQEQQAETLEAEQRLLPRAEIDPKAWQNLNLDVRYSAARIESENLPIDRIKAHVVSKDGWLTVDPLETGLADGSILGFVSLDGTQVPVAGEFDIRLDALQLQDMLAKLGVGGEGLGKIDGRIRFKGQGRSVDELLATADGQIGLAMTGGGLDALITEAIGLDIAESLAVLLGSAEQAEEDKVPIRCAIANLALEQGIATAQPIVIDTIDSKITVEGQVNLKDETLDVFVQSFPKDVSVLSANQPISIEGKLLSPTVGPAPGKVENQALGWLLAPVAALLPFFDVGGEEDSPCARLVAQAKEAARERPEEE